MQYRSSFDRQAPRVASETGKLATPALKRRRADKGWARDKRTHCTLFLGICWELIPEIVIMAYGTYIIASEIANQTTRVMIEVRIVHFLNQLHLRAFLVVRGFFSCKLILTSVSFLQRFSEIIELFQAVSNWP